MHVLFKVKTSYRSQMNPKKFSTILTLSLATMSTRSLPLLDCVCREGMYLRSLEGFITAAGQIILNLYILSRYNQAEFEVSLDFAIYRFNLSSFFIYVFAALDIKILLFVQTLIKFRD